MKTVTCCVCAWEFGMPDKVHSARLTDGKDFWCPLGHKQFFRLGPSKEQQEIEQLKWTNEHLSQVNMDLRAKNEDLRRVPCPVCGEKYLQLNQHISRSHPEEWDKILYRRHLGM